MYSIKYRLELNDRSFPTHYPVFNNYTFADIVSKDEEGLHLSLSITTVSGFSGVVKRTPFRHSPCGRSEGDGILLRSELQGPQETTTVLTVYPQSWSRY